MKLNDKIILYFIFYNNNCRDERLDFAQFRHTLSDISIVHYIVNSLVKQGETSPGEDTNFGKASSRQLQAAQVHHTVPMEGEFGVD